MAGLALAGITKRYGTLSILHGIDLDIADGEFVVLVGPSGCGKSTLLRMIAGLEPIGEGEIRIGGARANDLPAQKRNVAMVFQSYALFPHLTARQNIAYGPKLRGESPDAIAAKVARAGEILNLGAYLDRYPRQLSGGQRQRVAMGRAIVRAPALFLFDEPLSNLDAQLRVQMRAEIKALHGKLRTTTVYVTHDQIEAMTLADRMVVMNGGRVEQQGRPLDIYDRPANLFVARFIGSPSMNLIDGAVRDGVFRSASGETVPVAGTPDVAEAVLGVRPEHLAPTEGGLPMTVTVVEPTGAETFLYGTMLGRTVVVLLRDRTTLRPGDTVPLAPTAAHVFDRRSGARV